MFVSEIYDEISEILGTTDQTKIFRKLTQAVQALMESGHWFHSNREVDVCTGWDGVTVTLPRDIEVPLAVNIDGSPTYFRGRLFQYHVNKGGMYNTVEWAWDDRGVVATQMDIRQPAQVIAVAETDADIGATLRLVGTDNNNRDLRTQYPDGTNVDGLIIPINSLSDFNRGSITPSGNTIVTRDVAISPFNKFVSNTEHQFSTGQSVVLNTVTGTTPIGLTNSDQYYVGVVDPYTIQLYTDPLYAQSKEYPVSLTSIASAGTLSFTDQRDANPVTSIHFASAPALTISQGNEVVFHGSPLPSPLVSGVTYFVNILDSTNLQVFASLQDALNNKNPIYLTGSNAAFTIQIRKVIAPITQLVFPVAHLYSTGDLVQSATNGGTLPQPLVSGQNYYVHVIDSLTVTLHTSYADAVSGNNIIVMTTSGTGQNSLTKLIPATVNLGNTNNVNAPGFTLPSPQGSGASATAVVSGPVTSLTLGSSGSGYTSTPSVTISGGGGSGATAYAVIGTVSGSSQYQTVIAVVIQNPGKGYTSNPNVLISGGNGNGANATATITPIGVTSFTNIIGGSGYTVPPFVVFPAPGIGQTAPVATAQITNGVVTAINVVSQGSGYTTAPTVTLVTSLNVYVGFTSTGTLPSPLVQGNSYLAQPPNSGSTFTLVNDDNSPVNITSLGNGTLYLALTRSFSVQFTNQWSGDFSVTPTGTVIYFGSDYLLPVTTPQIDNGVTSYYLKRITNSIAEVYVESSLSTKITVTQLGTGQAYFALQYSVTPKIYNNYLALNSLQYIQNGTNVIFNTDGTLPAPLLPNTNYTVKIVDNYLQVYSGSSLINFTTLPVGQLKLSIVRNFTVVPSTSLTFLNAVFQTGTPVIPRPVEGDILDPSLVAGTEYFVRLLNSSSVELYDTQSHANNTSSTQGRLSYVTIGNTSSSTFVLDAIENPTFVKAIYHIDKPVTEGYVSLYAYDYGRSNDMALIGQYHPSETNPQYRRVRLGKPCSWARIIYRVKAPKISSKYDYIPLEQTRAIIAAVHAVDLEDKDFMDQATKYWAMALNYLKNQQNSMEGHAMQPPQINNETYGDGTDWVMF